MQVCPACGHQSPPSFRFCDSCGQALAGSAAPAEAGQPPHSPRRLGTFLLIGLGVAAIAVVAFVLLTRKESAPTTTAATRPEMAFLRSGDPFVLTGGKERLLAGGLGLTDISWYPDGKALLGVREGSALRIPLERGAPTSVDLGRRSTHSMAVAPSGAIAFTALDDSGLEQVWLALPNAQPQQLTTIAPNEDAGGDPDFNHLSFSFDGNTILAIAGRRSDFQHIMAFDVSTGAARPIHDRPAEGRAALATDGTLYWAGGGFNEGSFQTDIRLYKGNDLLLERQDDCHDPAIAPDATRLAFVCEDDFNETSSPSAIWTLSLEPGSTPKLSVRNAEDPEWYPSRRPGSPTSSTTKSSPEPTQAGVVAQDTFTLRLPSGWRKYSEKGRAPEEIGFSDGRGRYFKVLVWDASAPPTGEYSTDITWQLALNSSSIGYVIRDKGSFCPKGEVYCETGDDELSIYALAKDGPEAIRGKIYQFSFGYTHGERGVDTEVFERILVSFRGR